MPLGHEPVQAPTAPGNAVGKGIVPWYVLLSVSAHGWTLEAAGDRDPAGARLGAMLQVLAAREPSRKLPLIRTWWPRSFPVPPQWQLTGRTDARDLLMMRPFVELSRPLTADDVFYWRADYF